MDSVSINEQFQLAGLNKLCEETAVFGLLTGWPQARQGNFYLFTAHQSEATVRKRNLAQQNNPLTAHRNINYRERIRTIRL